MKKGIRYWDWLAVTSLLAAMLISGQRLVDTEWTENLVKVQFSVLFACLLGFGLGYSAFRGSTAILLGIVYSMWGIIWQFGMGLGRNIAWTERLTSLYGGLSYAIDQFISNQVVTSSILFVFIMTCLYWILGITAGYSLVRHGKPWAPLLITGFAMLIIDHYPPYIESRNLYTGVFTLLVLVVVGRVFYLHQRTDWEKRDVQIDYGFSADLAKGVLVSSLVLVFLSWNIPWVIEIWHPGSTAQEQFSQFWEPMRRRLSKVVASLRSPLMLVGSDFYRDEMALGTSISESDEEILTFMVLSKRTVLKNIYWRGRSYDYYQNGQWENSIGSRKGINPGEWPLPLPDWIGRQTIDITIQTKIPSTSLLYLPGYPLKVSRPVYLTGNSTVEKGVLDSIALQVQQPINSGEIMRAEAWESIPSANQLMSAGVTYPAWVRTYYLQLPVDLPNRIGELATEIASGSSTQYEKVVAVTDYLRKNIEYQSHVDPIPPLREPLDWFLFDYQKGYCNYYASAEVILLRSLGIPARLVAGYAQGLAGTPPGLYHVRIKDSHSWVEVYFPGLGWVEFEPTTALPIVEYDYVDPIQFEDDYESVGGQLGVGGIPESRFDRLDDLEDRNQQTDVMSVDMEVILIWIVLFFIVGSGYFWWKYPGWRPSNLSLMIETRMSDRGWRIPTWLFSWNAYHRLSKIERYFHSIKWMLWVYGEKVSPSQTPRERAGRLVNKIPQIADACGELLKEYERSVYSPYGGDAAIAYKAYKQMWSYLIKDRMNKIVGL